METNIINELIELNNYKKQLDIICKKTGDFVDSIKRHLFIVACGSKDIVDLIPGLCFYPLIDAKAQNDDVLKSTIELIEYLEMMQSEYLFKVDELDEEIEAALENIKTKYDYDTYRNQPIPQEEIDEFMKSLNK